MEINVNRKLIKLSTFLITTKNQDIEIYFKFNDLVSPYDLLISPDAKKLGIPLKIILVQEVQ